MIPLKRKLDAARPGTLEQKQPSSESFTREPHDPGIAQVGFGKYRDLTLEQLAKQDKEYCRWVLAQKDPDNFRMRRLQDFLRKQHAKERSEPVKSKESTDLEIDAIPGHAPLAPVPSWVKELLSISTVEPVSKELESTALTGLSSKIINTLHEYQRHGIAFGVQHGGRVLLADEMGLGKTVQALGIVAFYKREWPVLVVVPASLRLAWKAEISRWLSATAQVVLTGADHFYSENDFYIVSYDLLHRHPKFQSQANGKRFAVVICDESHFLKTWQAQRTGHMVPLLQNAQRAVLISGSPALNNAFELYPQLAALLPAVMPSPCEFGQRYCVSDHQQGREMFSGSVRPSELRQVLSSVMIRREKAEVLRQLPQKRRRTVPLELPPVAALQWEGDAEVQRVEKGWQSVYARVGLAKADIAADYIEMLASSLDKDKLLVFFHHEVVGNIIEARVQQAKIGHVRIDGKTPAVKRGLEACRFQEDPSVRIAVLSITACGVGLTLTAASVVVFAELYSVPKIMEQAEDRAHRIGQTSSVDIHYLVARGTVDDGILACMARKRADLQHLLPHQEGSFQELEKIKPVKPLRDSKMVPAVRASARPLVQTTTPERLEDRTQLVRGSTAKGIKTVRSRGLSFEQEGPQRRSSSHNLTSMSFGKSTEHTGKQGGRTKGAVEIVLDETSPDAPVPNKPVSVVLDDSEDEAEGPAVAQTMEDSDSDVQIGFG